MASVVRFLPLSNFRKVCTSGKYFCLLDVKQMHVRMCVCICVSAAAFEQIQNNTMSKGDVYSVARIAGIQAAKHCASLIPLCHPLLLTKVDIQFEADAEQQRIRIVCRCKLNSNTGVEMEALTAVSVTALTIFDMCKAIDPAMRIEGIRVLQKQGGKTDYWEAEKL